MFGLFLKVKIILESVKATVGLFCPLAPVDAQLQRKVTHLDALNLKEHGVYQK